MYRDPSPSPLNFVEIPMIFCKHVSCLFPSAVQNLCPSARDSTKWWPFCIKKITLLHFSPRNLGLLQGNLAGTLLGVRGTFTANLTSNDLDLGKWQQILMSEIRFLHFSPNLSWLFQRNFVGTLLRVRGTLSANLTLKDLDLVKWRPF